MSSTSQLEDLLSDPGEVRKLRAYADAHLYFFCKNVLGFKDMVPELHGELCAFLESGELRKLVLIPRGGLKSSICSIGYVIWRLCRDPNLRIAVISSTQPKASKMMGLTRDMFQKESTTPMMRALYPDRLVDAKYTRKNPWNNDHILLPRTATHLQEYSLHAFSVNGSVSGYHFDMIVFDDLIDEKTANSEAEMSQAVNFFKNHEPLYHNPGTGEGLVIGTRYGIYDLYQFIIDDLPDYKVFYRSCVRDIVTHEPSYSLDDDAAEPIWPERFTMEVLRGIKKKMGDWYFSCNYFLKPVTEENCPFVESDLRFYELDSDGQATLLKFKNLMTTNPMELDRIMIVDPASSREDSGHACDSAIVVVGKHHSGKFYVLEAFGEKVNPDQLIDQMFALNKKWTPRCCYLEDIAFQGSLIYMKDNAQYKHRQQFCRIEPIHPGARAKDDRILGLEPYIKNHQLYVRRDQKKLLHQLTHFQKGHKFQVKDILDALAYAPMVWRLPLSPEEYTEQFERDFGNRDDDGFRQFQPDDGRCQVTGY